MGQAINCFSYEEELKRAKMLLSENEADNLPKSIYKTLQYCTHNGIGFILSRNSKVYSCKDARNHRYRLGHIGIPLFDELKSIVLKGLDLDGNEVVFAAHCRGDMILDFDNLMSLLNLQSLPVLLDEDELVVRFGMVLGIVNPILLEVDSDGEILNIFDVRVFSAIAPYPGTMMTNAGEHTWAIEFEPNQLVASLKNKRIETIAKHTNENGINSDFVEFNNPKSIGIITGNGAESGITLWSNINRCFVEYLGEQFLGDISLPKIHIASIPEMGLSMEMDKRDDVTWDAISAALRDFKRLDVDLLALACNTTHYYTDKIRKEFDSENRKFLSMAEATMNFISDNDLDDIAILGIRLVADLKEYSAYKDLGQLRTEKISEDIMSRFHNLCYEVKKMGNQNAITQKFIALLRNDIKSKNIILALTELSIINGSVKKRQYSEKTIIDSLSIYADIITRASLGIL